MEVACEYPPPVSSPGTQIMPVPTSTSHNLAVASAQTQLVDYLGASINGRRSQGVENLQALHHFQEVTCHTFGAAFHVMRTVVGNNIWQHPYLMHMAIAVSSGHQRRLLGKSSQSKKLRTLEFDEVNHWQSGLQMFQTELSRRNPTPGPNCLDFDSMVAAIFLTIVFTFAMHDGNGDRNSITDDEDFVQRIITPMSSTGGFRALQAIRDGPIETSLWIPILYASDDADGSFTSSTQGTEGLPPAFVQLCELDENSSSDTSSYHAILRHLTPLLKMEPTPRNLSKLFAFSGRLHRTFRPLVAENDPRGLLLLAWWLALLRQIDEWFVRAWAESACNSIVAYLSTAPDPRIQALLVFPATFGTADFSWIWGNELDNN
ncbi:hypothetical protein Q7P37_011413 [Cladosporium fusiforme]